MPSSLRRLRVTGVPEHFNFPWQLAIKDGAFERAGLSVEFTACPGGTGAMLQAVTAGDADVAVALTEGILAGVVAQETTSTPLRYCGEYVSSSLRWMIATGSERPFQSLSDVVAKDGASETGQLRVAVSRLGSGSHLMAYLLALREQWPTNRLSFVIMRDFRSMRRSVVDGSCDLFMWEWTMTSPFVESGELRPLGWLDTPWGCFGFVARRAWLEDPGHRALLADAAAVALRAAADMKGAGANAACEALAAMYGFSLADAHAWLRGVEYALPPPPPPQPALVEGCTESLGPATLSAPRLMLQEALRLLVAVGIVPQGAAAAGGASEASSGYDLPVSIVETRVCAIVDGAGAAARAGARAEAAGVPSRDVVLSSRGSTSPPFRSPIPGIIAPSASALPQPSVPSESEDRFTPRLQAADAAVGAAHARAAAAAADHGPPTVQVVRTSARLRGDTAGSGLALGDGAAPPPLSLGAGAAAAEKRQPQPAAAAAAPASSFSVRGEDVAQAKAAALRAVLAHLGAYGGAAERNVSSTVDATGPPSADGSSSAFGPAATPVLAALQPISSGGGGGFPSSPKPGGRRRSDGQPLLPPAPLLLHPPPAVAFSDVQGVMRAARTAASSATTGGGGGGAAGTLPPALLLPRSPAAASTPSLLAASLAAAASLAPTPAAGGGAEAATPLTRPPSPTPETPALSVAVPASAPTAGTGSAGPAGSSGAWLHDVSLAVALPAAALLPPAPPAAAASASASAAASPASPPPLRLVASRPGLPRLHLLATADGGIAIQSVPLALLHQALQQQQQQQGGGGGEAPAAAARSVILSQPEPRPRGTSGSADAGAAGVEEARAIAWHRLAPGSAWEGSLFDIG